MREFVINENDSGQRLDKFVLKAVKGIPVSFVYKSIRLKKIKVNRKRAEEKQILKKDDVVQMFISEEFFGEKVSKEELLKVNTGLDIVYEDENIILVEKAPGVLVHTGDGDGKEIDESVSNRNTLIYHIQAYLAKKGEYDPEKENSFTPALCNRIDRNTGGIVIAAKNASALRDMNKRIKDGCIFKFYLCLCHGKLEKESGILRDYIKKDDKENIVKVYGSEVEGSKEIITGYKVLFYDREKDISALEVELFTGRTHQIRAHLAFYSHPLVGDGKYGVISEDKKYGFKHQALYAYKVSFGDSSDTLEYLNGKSFHCKIENIYFLTTKMKEKIAKNML